MKQFTQSESQSLTSKTKSPVILSGLFFLVLSVISFLPVSAQKDLYVNDNSTAGDRFTTAIGNDVTGLGTTSAPFRTMNKAMSFAAPGDLIWVDAGNYSENVHINKSLKFYGANYDRSPVTGVRLAESIITPPTAVNPEAVIAFLAHTLGTNVEVKGFKFTNCSPLSDAHEQRTGIQDIVVLFEKNLVEHGYHVYAGTLTKWKTVTIKDNFFSMMDWIPGASNGVQIYDAVNALVGPHAATVIASITDNKIETTNANGIILDNLLSATVQRNIVKNTPGEAGIQLSGGMVNATVSENEIDNANTAHLADGAGIRIQGTTFTGTVNITNNKVTNSWNGFAVKNGENIAGKAIHVNFNSFDLSNANKSVYHGGSGNLDATCNWHGSNVSATVSSRIFTPAIVTFIPYLTIATDVSANLGFQPDPSPANCSGTTTPPDLTPRITLNPNNIIGSSTEEITIQINEINNATTTGLITLFVDKLNLFSNFSFDPTRTTNSAGQPVQNNLFSIDAISNPNFYVITTTAQFANTLRRVVFTVTANPGGTKGTTNVNVFLNNGSGGETNFNNNADFASLTFSF